jgi:hypothetical protein
LATLGPALSRNPARNGPLTPSATSAKQFGVFGELSALEARLLGVWLSYCTLTVKPRGQAYAAGEV